MNPGGIPGIGPGHHVIRSGSLPGHGAPRPSNNSVAGRKSAGPGTTTGGKLMRLRCRFRPLHDAYLKDGFILEDDTDVIFVCGDGHQLRAHRVIMASASKFFASLFEDQVGEVSVVSVPDIKVDVMKLILHLTYRDRVILTMNQIREVGEFITMFGMAWAQFGFEEYEGEESMTAVPKPPVSPVEIPRRVLVQGGRPAGVPLVQRKVLQPNRMQVKSNYKNTFKNEEQEEEAVEEADEEEEFQVQPGYGNGSPQEQGERSGGHSRKSRLTPRTGFEDGGANEMMEQDEEEDPENLIRDWMSKLGKREGSSQNSSISPVKRMRLEEPPQPLATAAVPKKPGGGTGKNVCTVCKTAFQTESAWRWHEDRHVGIGLFKCKFCDTVSRTPKLCYIHEKEVHGYSGLQQLSTEKPEHNIQQQQQQQQKSILVRTNQTGKVVVMNHKMPMSEAHKIVQKRIKMAQYKKMHSQKKRERGPYGNRNTQIPIGVGESEGAEFFDAKKIKQLHWLYVCDRCDNCSDSASKATIHYDACYPNKEKGFEATVTKYRQGFYGRSKCPLCPRRYPQTSGFMIHCGHQHQDYRRLFTHNGIGEDTLKCLNCKEKFVDPQSFHEHLEATAQGKYQCRTIAPGKKSSGGAAAAETTGKTGRNSGSSASGATERPARVRRAQSPIESKASYKVQFHTPPRSARLASRAQAEATAEANNANKAKTATDINFPPVDCPVCGDSELPNISLHLQTKHKDLNVDVTRISSELLRCKGCTITFDICDLLDHKDCMLPDDGEKDLEAMAAKRRASTSSTKAAITTTPAPVGRPPNNTVVDVDSLPEGVGRSPIECIEINDLNSIQAIRTALKCLVCGHTAKKLGIIADCLRSHGVFRCALCFNSYVNKADYGTHLKKCHGCGANKLKCPLCPKSFANAGQTSGHMYSTHWLQMLKEAENSIEPTPPESLQKPSRVLPPVNDEEEKAAGTEQKDATEPANPVDNGQVISSSADDAKDNEPEGPAVNESELILDDQLNDTPDNDVEEEEEADESILEDDPLGGEKEGDASPV